MIGLLSRSTPGRISRQCGFVDPFANSLYAFVIMTWFLAGGYTPVGSLIECLDKQDSQYRCITPGLICISPTSVNEATYRAQRNQCRSQIMHSFNIAIDYFCYTHDCTGIKLSEPAATVKDNARTQCDTSSGSATSSPTPLNLPANMANLNSLLSAAGAGNLTCPGTTNQCTGYSYSDWSPCSASGQQSRQQTGFLPAGCTGTPPGLPELYRVCTPACTGYLYTDWTPSVCPANGQQTRQQTGFDPVGCTGTPPGPPELTRQCTPAPSGTVYKGPYRIQTTMTRQKDRDFVIYTCTCTFTKTGNITATFTVAPDNTIRGTATNSDLTTSLSSCRTDPAGMDACYPEGGTSEPPLGFSFGSVFFGTMPNITAWDFGGEGSASLCLNRTDISGTVSDTSISGTLTIRQYDPTDKSCSVSTSSSQILLQRQ